MPEYLAPGVYVEETSFRPKTIEGVSTSTAAFVGPTRFGPVDGTPELVTSFPAFERIYGGLDQLDYDGTRIHNYTAHAVRAFFENGGRRLYVVRAYEPGDDPGEGYAQQAISSGANQITVSARHPGLAGETVVTFAFRLGANMLAHDASGRGVLPGASDHDVVWIGDLDESISSPPVASPPGSGALFWLEPHFDDVQQLRTHRLRRTDADTDKGDPLLVTQLTDQDVRRLTVTVTMGPMGRFTEGQTWEDLAFHPKHPEALTTVFTDEPESRATELFVPLVLSAPGLSNGVAIAEALLSQPLPEGLLPESPPLSPPQMTLLDTLAELGDLTGAEFPRFLQVRLRKGSDGQRPGQTAYAGGVSTITGAKRGLMVLEDVEDVSIVAAPGSTADYTARRTDVETIQGLLVAHCERMRYRVAVLDSPSGQLLSEVRNYRGRMDSKYAAIYYPWVTILDPITGGEIQLPPSGFVAGIYARNDVERGVHKAPANEVVRLAIGFEQLLNKAQQDVLNPAGVNCFRYFGGRGHRLWGARTITSDKEWTYVNVRRYFVFLEHSIDRGTQWAVFENNGPQLWGNIRQTIDDFLFNEWKSGHLLGEKPEEAYFVRCDLSTMTQSDLDNGRLICQIGVAPLRPAEFVIFRIGQKTLDSRT